MSDPSVMTLNRKEMCPGVLMYDPMTHEWMLILSVTHDGNRLRWTYFYGNGPCNNINSSVLDDKETAAFGWPRCAIP
jgi:hypothetical protein